MQASYLERKSLCRTFGIRRRTLQDKVLKVLFGSERSKLREEWRRVTEQERSQFVFVIHRCWGDYAKNAEAQSDCTQDGD
jgi:hypothetical protein